MFVKVAAAFYAVQMFLHSGDNSDDARSHTAEPVATTSDLSRRKQQNDEKTSIRNFDQDDNEVDAFAEEISPPTKVVVKEEEHFVLPSKIQIQWY